MKLYTTLFILIVISTALRAQNASGLNINENVVFNKKNTLTDTTMTQPKKYLYYDINLISGGGARSKADYFLDFELFDISLGYGSTPILFGFKIMQFQTFLPWGSETMFSSSVGARYIWGTHEKTIQRFVYADGNWGTYSKEEQEESALRSISKDYSCWYLDIGFGATIQTVDFEIGGFPLNGLKAQLGWRIGDVKDGIDNPMLGIYASAKLRLGWFGAKSIK